MGLSGGENWAELRTFPRERRPAAAARKEWCTEMSDADLTDGFHLVVDALKLNGVDTIFGVAGIPITDLLRLAQNEGIRYFGFRRSPTPRSTASP
jgi:hypothetical protein